MDRAKLEVHVMKREREVRHNRQKHGGKALVKAIARGESWIDLRTRTGKYVTEARRGLLEDMGGRPNTSQGILLDRVCEQIAVLSRMAEWALRQKSIVTKEGSLLPALGREYLAWSNSLRLNLRALQDLGKQADPQGIDYEKYIASLKPAKRDKAQEKDAGPIDVEVAPSGKACANKDGSGAVPGCGCSECSQRPCVCACDDATAPEDGEE
ncbi:MAG: hypothetical protein JRJ16_06835 [Deltaproteobacteria bacterium]|nr:hypothetical protein [Deltaproteobacteria bacterium]